MITDPISDLLTRIRNATKAHKLTTSVPHSKLKLAILDVLKKRGFVQSFSIDSSGTHPVIEIEFNPENRFSNLKRISKPGQRIYLKRSEIKPVLNGYGFSILSTPRGVLTGTDAYRQGVGGEVICEVT